MPSSAANHPLENDFKDFFEHSLCGLLIINMQGKITAANPQMATWLNCPAPELTGKYFTDALSIGSRLLYETMLFPTLRMQHSFDEASLELVSTDCKRTQVLVNAYERLDETGKPLHIRFTLFRATDRRLYEQNLQLARKEAENKLLQERADALLREQFIAVLGHDLRNPLSAVLAASELLQKGDARTMATKLGKMINGSGLRMLEMIENILDFARARLGNGIAVHSQPTAIEPVLAQVVNELHTAWPNRQITVDAQANEPIVCDGPRLGQLLSNLVANALVHGAADGPVVVQAGLSNRIFTLSVCNQGQPIPPAVLINLFKPFKRESARPSQQGLGLGLYIASEIARAHKGELIATSTEVETCFTFSMPMV